MNLSPTQQDVILRMADGARLYLVRVPQDHYVLLPTRAPTIDVVDDDIEALNREGAIRRGPNAWLTCNYALTDAGRAEAARIREKGQSDE